MERLRWTIGLLSLVLIGGGLAVLHAVVLPVLERHPLLDPNLASAVSDPLRTGTVNLMLAGSLVLVLLAPRILPHWGSAAAGGLTLLLLLDRLWLLPRAQDAWSRVDRVTGRPIQHLEQARAHAQLELGLTWAIVVLFLLVIGCWAGCRSSAPRVAKEPGGVEPVQDRPPAFTTSQAVG